MARKRIESGGWTRQVTARELPISKSIAGVEMRLTAGGVRELHWHVSSEWAIMLYGNARITAVDAQGKSFVSDVSDGDLWLFPPGVPHSIQGLGPDGCQFLLVFDDGNFNEFETFLLTDWLTHTPKEVLAKNFGVNEATFDKRAEERTVHFPDGTAGGLEERSSPTWRKELERCTADGFRTEPDEADEGDRGRGSENYRCEEFSDHDDPRGDREAEARRSARTALASERG